MHDSPADTHCQCSDREVNVSL